MKLTQIAGGDCGRDDCPTIFLTDRGTIAIQGYLIEKQTPAGEAAVEIPLTVLREAIAALAGPLGIPLNKLQEAVSALGR